MEIRDKASYDAATDDERRQYHLDKAKAAALRGNYALTQDHVDKAHNIKAVKQSELKTINARLERNHVKAVWQ